MKDVRGRIVAQLASEAYATGKDWSLVWGPIKTKSTDNRAYIAKNTVDGSFAVCLRGATTQFLSPKEDIPTGQTTFQNGNCISATVGAEFYSSLYAMITAQTRRLASRSWAFWRATQSQQLSIFSGCTANLTRPDRQFINDKHINQPALRHDAELHELQHHDIVALQFRLRAMILSETFKARRRQ